MSKNKLAKIIVIIVGIIVIGIVGWMLIDKNTVSGEIDYANQPRLGDEDAQVQILEFGDYKCPYCKIVSKAYLPKLQEDYIDTGKVSFYYMNYDFLNIDSTRAAEFAEVVYKELGNEEFWKFHTLLYDYQPDDENLDFFTEQRLVDLLSSVTNEANVEIVKEAFDNGEGKDALAIDNEYVEKLGISYTPTILINGVEFTGDSYEALEAELNNLIEE